MNNKRSLDMSLLSFGMTAVLIAQFLSALADNAILIAAIAIVKSQGLLKVVPLLQEAFVVPYVLLAPFVGQVADRFSKGRVMLGGNLLKLFGALAMTLGMNPLAAYGVIGVGAAIYSPAKYGILAQMFLPEKLVRANGMMEGSTIVAILLGVVLGGWMSDYSLRWTFNGVMLCYAVAAFFNLLIPNLPPENLEAQLHPWKMSRKFLVAVSTLFRSGDGRFSLLGTGVFWGSGSALRLMLFAWVPAVLLITDNKTPADMMAVLSVGVVVGAAAAGIWVSLANVNRALIGGLLLGPAILALAFVTKLGTAMVFMAIVGICGGFFVVPLNALLQEYGHQSVGAGNALAVQNFVENIFMLVFVGAYGLAATALPITACVFSFGLVLLLSICTLSVLRLRRVFAG